MEYTMTGLFKLFRDVPGSDDSEKKGAYILTAAQRK
jgi:hypothetical protein